MKIEDMVLTSENLKTLDEHVQRFNEVQNIYYKKKKELADIVAVKPQQEHDEDVERLEGEIRSLRENRGNMYYDLGNMVKTMICSNPLYQRLVEKYYDFCAYTDNVIEMHKLQITLVKNKKYLDDFFDSVKRELERNTAVPEGKLKHYNFLYKDIIKLLGEVFEDMESQNSTGKEEENGGFGYQFSDELDFSDTYNLLSIISFFYSNIINPVYNNFNDMYIDYQERRHYIKRFDARIIELLNSVI